jgi:hypothetical protein
LGFQSWRVPETIWRSFQGTDDRTRIDQSLVIFMDGYADISVFQKQVQHASNL